MDGSGQLADRKRGAAPLWAGELIVQNGRQSGARRPLQVPLTFIGRAQGCDIRLNVDGMDPMHCLLVHGPSGLLIRDLDSTGGTFVNGERVTNVNLKDGDLLTVGPFQFRLHLPPANFAISERAAVTNLEMSSGDRDGLRLQVAAVAAQQVSLGEEEVRLLHRKAALERQEEQLASHLEEKRRKLLALNERAQSERHALQQDRAAYERHLEKITSDLTAAQRETLQNREKLQAQRRRLAELYRRLRARLQHLERAQKDDLKHGYDALAKERANLEALGRQLHEREEELLARQLKFNGQYESGRQQLKIAWARLRESQARWRQRRKQELAVLKQREHDAAVASQEASRAVQQLHEETKVWEVRRPALERELEGLTQRVKNQRHKILEHQLEINRLDNLLRLRPERQGDSRQADSTALVPLPLASDGDKKKGVRQQGKGKKGRGKNDPAAMQVEIVPLPTSDNPTWRQFENEVQRRLAHLEQLAGDLADQRLQVLEHWQRLVHTQLCWEKDRAQMAADLENVALRLHQQEESLNQRERTYEQTDHQMRLRYRELVHLRQHLIGWRARLKTRENGLESERQQLLNDVQGREDLVEKQLGNLVELRQRWAKRRRQELTRFEADRTALQQMQQECQALRADLARRTTQLEEEKRELSEKTLALEQYRQDFFIRLNQPGTGERRLDRLRRRWLTQHALLVRGTVQEREALQQELTRLTSLLQDLQKRQIVVEKAEHELTDKQAAFEHKQALAAARNARLEQELQSSQSQRQLIEQQLGRMKEEIERIARQLLDDPDPPANQSELAA